jgi:hypothetical protein
MRACAYTGSLLAQAQPVSHSAGSIAGMPSQFTPAGAPIPCWACFHFAGMTRDYTAALCNLPNACRVRAMPEHGCACWMREPGCDDEPGPPRRPTASVPRQRSDAPRQAVEWAP